MICQKCIEKNSKYSKNNKFNKDCKLQQNFATNFCRNLAKICLIEIACRNLVVKSAKFAKVTRNFIAPKTPDIYRKNNNVHINQIRLIKKKVLKALKKKLANFAKIKKLTRIY